MFANCYKDEKCYSLHGTLSELPLSAYVPSATAPHLLTWDTLYNRNSCSLPTDCPQPERDVRVRPQKRSKHANSSSDSLSKLCSHGYPFKSSTICVFSNSPWLIVTVFISTATAGLWNQSESLIRSLPDPIHSWVSLNSSLIYKHIHLLFHQY